MPSWRWRAGTNQILWPVTPTCGRTSSSHGSSRMYVPLIFVPVSGRHHSPGSTPRVYPWWRRPIKHLRASGTNVANKGLPHLHPHLRRAHEHHPLYWEHNVSRYPIIYWLTRFLLITDLGRRDGHSEAWNYFVYLHTLGTE